MDDALRVRGPQGFRDLPGYGQGLVERNRAPRETLGQVFAVDQFHNERTGGVALVHPVDMGDVRMIQRGERLRFACEPRESVGIIGEGVRKDFQGDVAIEPRIACAVTSPIPPAPNAERISYGPSRAPGVRAKRVATDYTGWRFATPEK
jgi:hypothetical protein